MSYGEGFTLRRLLARRARVSLIAVIVTSMLGVGLTLALTSPTVDAGPLSAVVDGSTCYSIDEGPGNAGVSPQYLHEVALTNPGGTPAASSAANYPVGGVVGSPDAGNIENIAIRNDASELYAYDPAGGVDAMLFFNADTGATSTPTEFNLSGLGDIDAMFFQNDANGDPSDDILWTVLDVDDGTPGNSDADVLTGYNAAGAVVGGPVAITLPTDQTIEGATWLPSTGEFFISYTETSAATDSVLASLGSGAVPSTTPAVVGTTQVDVEGLGTDGADQLFLTTGEDPPAGPAINQFWHVDDTSAATTTLLDLSVGAPVDGNADFESVDCAYAAISLTKVATTAPTRNADGTTNLSYTFTITNTGALQLGNVLLTDPMTEFVAAGTIESGPTPDDVAGDCSSAVAGIGAPQTLNIGESCTAVWEYVVDVPPATYTNTACVDATPPNGVDNAVQDCDDETIIVPPQTADLEIIKAVRADAADCPATFADALPDDGLGTRLVAADGTDVVYCINVINNGPGIAQNVEVTDDFDPSDPRDLGTLAAAGEASYNYTHTVGAAEETNTATVTGDDEGNNPIPPDSDDAGTTPPAPTGSIGDRVWEDTNEDGLQSGGELGVSGITVNLWDDDAGSPGMIIDTQNTDINGEYLFTGLAAGNYYVQFVAPGRTFTLQGVGLDTAIDSNPDPADGITPVIALPAGGVDLTIDAGLVPLPPDTATIGDFVWNDLDSDGIQDAGEPGVEGVTVLVYETDAAGNLLPGDPVELTTNSSGIWSLVVSPGFYRVNFVEPTTGGFLGFTTQDAGTDDAVDSDVAITGGDVGFTDVYDVPAGTTNLTIDAGLIFEAALGDFVWSDDNSNGIQDAGELGIGGVAVNVVDASNTVVGTDTTASDGSYLVTGLTPNVPYTVTFINTTTGDFTTQDAGTDDAVDSDADASGTTAAVTLASGETNRTIDAGIVSPLLGSIGNFVFDEVSDPACPANAALGDGIQDAGEAGVSGITVNLWSESATNPGTPGAIVETQVTGADGSYLFQDLTAGNYFVEFVVPMGTAIRGLSPANQGADDALDSDPIPDAAALFQSGVTGIIALAAGENNDTVDAGISCRGVDEPVCLDINGNVVRDAAGNPLSPGDPRCNPPCTDNDGNPIPAGGTCPTILQYPGPFNNMPPMVTSTFALPTPTPTTPDPGLAITGAQAGLLATLSAALMAAGGVLNVGARRRRMD